MTEQAQKDHGPVSVHSRAARWQWGHGVGGNLLHAIPTRALAGMPATAACGVRVVAWALLARPSLPASRRDEHPVDTPLCSTCQGVAFSTGGRR